MFYKNIWNCPVTACSTTGRPSSLFGEETLQHVLVHVIISVFNLTAFRSQYCDMEVFQHTVSLHCHPVSTFHKYHSLTPDVTYEQMEIFHEYHNRTAVQRGRVDGNVGRMSCEILRSRPLWLWLGLKEETRTLLSQNELNMEAYIQRGR